MITACVLESKIGLEARVGRFESLMRRTVLDKATTDKDSMVACYRLY